MDKGLPAKAGIDCHHQDQVQPIENMLQTFGWGVRVQRHTGTAPQFANARQGAVKMRTGLGMDCDDFGTSLGIAVQQRIRIGHHQMRIKRPVGHTAQRGNHRWAKGQVRHKMPIHHIEVDPVCTSPVNGGHFIGQPAEV